MSGCRRGGDEEGEYLANLIILDNQAITGCGVRLSLVLDGILIHVVRVRRGEGAGVGGEEKGGKQRQESRGKKQEALGVVYLLLLGYWAGVLGTGAGEWTEGQGKGDICRATAAHQGDGGTSLGKLENRSILVVKSLLREATDAEWVEEESTGKDDNEAVRGHSCGSSSAACVKTPELMREGGSLGAKGEITEEAVRHMVIRPARGWRAVSQQSLGFEYPGGKSILILDPRREAVRGVGGKRGGLVV